MGNSEPEGVRYKQKSLTVHDECCSGMEQQGFVCKHVPGLQLWGAGGGDSNAAM